MCRVHIAAIGTGDDLAELSFGAIGSDGELVTFY